MSYLVMARRWRPQRFQEVIGQQHVTRTLQQAIARGRVAHAYIFTGPRGVGKTTVARLLAKTVNCRNLQTDSEGLPEPCHECDSCTDIAAGNALDVLEIDGASNNKVEDVRTLRENIKFSPSSLEKKVYIIDEVHMLSQAAFNAMLKTLEEPPEHAMFIFATTEIHKVPATVLSRCQRFDFKRIPTRGIREQLERIVKGDSLAVDEEALVSISVKAEGALRDALSILDQLVAYQGDDPITGDVVRQALGLIATDLFFRATDLAATGRVAEAIDLAGMIRGGGHDPREFLHGFQRHVMHLLFLKSGGKVEELEASEEHRKHYAQVQGQHTTEDLLRMAEWAAETEDLLRDALDPQLRLELFLVRLARMDRAVELGALLETLGVAPESFQQPVQREAVTSPEPVKPAAPPKKPEKLEKPEPEQPAQPADAASPEEPGPVAKEEAAPTHQDEPETKKDDPAPEKEEPASEKVEPASEKEEPALESEPQTSVAAPKPAATPETGVNDSEEDEEEEAEGEEESTESEISLEAIRSRWLDFTDAISEEQHTLGSQVEQGAPTELDDEALTLTFPSNAKFAFDMTQQNRDVVRKAFRKQFGVGRDVRIAQGEIADKHKPPRRKSHREVKQQEFQLDLKEHPVWQSTVERLGLDYND